MTPRALPSVSGDDREADAEGRLEVLPLQLQQPPGAAHSIAVLLRRLRSRAGSAFGRDKAASRSIPSGADLDGGAN
jgi:hypothetical protein